MFLHEDPLPSPARLTNLTNRVIRRWHGDIKPENILDVETGFKLADPGEAVVRMVSPGENIDVKSLTTRVPGGTRTFGMFPTPHPYPVHK